MKKTKIQHTKSDSAKLHLVKDSIRQLQVSEVGVVVGGGEKLQKTSYC